MRLSSPFALLLVAASVLASACKRSEPGPSVDAGADLAPIPDGAVPLPPPPITMASVIPVSVDPTQMDYDGAFYVDPADGAWVVVFDRFVSQTVVASQLRIARSTDHQSFAASTQFPADTTDAAVWTPSVETIGPDLYVYFSHGDGMNTLTLARSPVTASGIGTPEDLVLADTTSTMNAWPLVSQRGSEYVLSYDHYAVSHDEVALGDGKTFAAPIEDSFGVQGRTIAASDGSYRLTMQDGNTPDTVYFRASATGATWSDPPQPVSMLSNTHDCTPFLRKDGHVDVYYIAPYNVNGFSIFRRQLASDGTLGVEERLSDDTILGTTQPRPHRMADGSIALVFAKQVTSNVDTDTYMVHLDSTDAP